MASLAMGTPMDGHIDGASRGIAGEEAAPSWRQIFGKDCYFGGPLVRASRKIQPEIRRFLARSALPKRLHAFRARPVDVARLDLEMYDFGSVL